MNGDDSNRITTLEINLAHLQRLYDQLNEVVTEQAIQADQMRRTIAELTKHLKEVKQKSTDDGFDIESEKPPHY